MINNKFIYNIQILTSGIDSLVLSFKIEWNNEEIFLYLSGQKEKAKSMDADLACIIKPSNGIPEWQFLMKPNGARGYEWLLTGHDYALKIGKWKEMITRPNIMAEIRSETLWALGVDASISYLQALIEGIGGQIRECKISRLDLCIDITFPDDLWKKELEDYIVTYADNKNIYKKGHSMTGISIGAGAIQARLYDKLLEIKQISKKEWLTAIWNMKEAPDGMKIIRVEFQMRREFLKEMKVNTPEDLLIKVPGLWGYCTQTWLKFQDNPECHHTMRKTFPWWNKVQDGFTGCQNSNPLVRDRAVTVDKQQRIDQVFGNVLSVKAIEMEHNHEDINKSITMMDAITTFFDDPLIGETLRHYDANERIKKKRARYHRIKTMDKKGGGENEEKIYTIYSKMDHRNQRSET